MMRSRYICKKFLIGFENTSFRSWSFRQRNFKVISRFEYHTEASHSIDILLKIDWFMAYTAAYLVVNLVMLVVTAITLAVKAGSSREALLRGRFSTVDLLVLTSLDPLLLYWKYYFPLLQNKPPQWESQLYWASYPFSKCSLAHPLWIIYIGDNC
jgi:hypothetical protein